MELSLGAACLDFPGPATAIPFPEPHIQPLNVPHIDRGIQGLTKTQFYSESGSKRRPCCVRAPGVYGTLTSRKDSQGNVADPACELNYQKITTLQTINMLPLLHDFRRYHLQCDISSPRAISNYCQLRLNFLNFIPQHLEGITMLSM